MEKKMIERREFLKFVGATVATGPLANMFPRVATPNLAELSTEGSTQVGGLPANWTGIHWQWEWPCWVPNAGQQFNMRAYISGLLETGVQMIHIFTRAEPGLWHFPTQIGFERDCTGRDWVLEVLEEIRRQGAEDRLKVIFYFTASWDNSAARLQPEWQQVDKDETGLSSVDKFGERQWDYVCLNSPWRDYCFAIMNEAAELYADSFSNVVGFYVDEPHFALNGCYCKWCKEGYRNMYGAELPRDFNADKNLWLNMHRFQVESILRFLGDINKEVISKHPQLVWTYNAVPNSPCNWNPRMWQTSSFNSNEVELGYLWALAWSKRMSGYGRPFEIAFGRDSTWTDQKPRPVHELKTMQGISVAHGGGVLIGDYPYPSGKFRANGLTWGNDLFKWKNAIQPWLDGAKNLSEVALFESWDTGWVRFVRSFNLDTGIWGIPRQCDRDIYFNVWAKLLTAANIQFDVVSENNLNTLSKYKVVILPDLLYLAEPTIQDLDRYVQAGGSLLSTYRTGLFNVNGDESPPPSLYNNLMGVRFRQWSNYRGNYIWLDDPALSQNLSPEPMLIMGPALLCEATTAQPLAWVTFPIEEVSPDTRVWYDYNPPRDNHETFPSISLNRRGQGQVLSIFHPLENVALKEDYWAPERLLLNAINRLAPERLIQITAPGEVIAITTIQEQRRRVIVHLFNEALWPGNRFDILSVLVSLQDVSLVGKQSPFPRKRPAVPDVQVELKAPFKEVKRIYEAPSRRNISFQIRRGATKFTVPKVDTHTVVVIEED